MPDPSRFSSAQEVQVVTEAGNTLGIRPDGSLIPTKTENELLSTGSVFSAAFEGAITGNGVTTPILLFRNPVGSGRIAYIKNISGVAVASAGNLVVFQLRFSPVVTTNGASVTPVCATAGLSITPSCLITRLPTVSSTGSLVLSSLAVSGTAGGEVVEIDADGRYAVVPGGSVLLTGRPDGNNRSIEVSILWAEE